CVTHGWASLPCMKAVSERPATLRRIGRTLLEPTDTCPTVSRRSGFSQSRPHDDKTKDLSQSPRRVGRQPFIRRERPLRARKPPLAFRRSRPTGLRNKGFGSTSVHL